MSTEIGNSYIITDNISTNNNFTNQTSKIVARVKLCGGALVFNFYDTDPIQFEMPTEEQRKNLKKTFGIEVEWAN